MEDDILREEEADGVPEDGLSKDIDELDLQELD
jgi:hypothetical protein